MLLIIILFLSLFIGPSYATCIGIGCTCSVSASTINFGVYNPFSATNLQNTGNVAVTCSALLVGLNVSYEISLNQGNGGSFNPRRMTNGISNLSYNLYTSSAYSTIWGTPTSGAGTGTVSDAYLLNLLSVTRNYTVYGRVPALQNVSPGSYTDTITVTVTY